MRYRQDQAHGNGGAIANRRFGYRDCRRICAIPKRRVWIDEQGHVRNGARPPSKVVELEVADALDRLAGNQHGKPVHDGEDVRGRADQTGCIEPMQPGARTDENHVWNRQNRPESTREPIPLTSLRLNRHGDGILR
jgi:hypothetical protein